MYSQFKRSILGTVSRPTGRSEKYGRAAAGCGRAARTGEKAVLMSKYCVKKPFTVLVAVVMVIVLGVISFMNMTTDLLPAMELPYVVVVTTYPGASPEKVETAVTATLEAGLGTVNGVSSVTSTSSENVSMVVLEFENGTNMDSAMVNLSTALDQVKGYLPDTAQNPMLL